MDETIEKIHIRYGDLEIHIPKSCEDIKRARKLLDMLEEELPKTWKDKVTDTIGKGRSESYTKASGSPQISSQVQTQGQPIESPVIAQESVPITFQKELYLPQIEEKPISAGEQETISTQTSKPSVFMPELILSNIFIPKFEWDKTKEKSYRTIFFYEHEDGSRVMIFYLNSRIFTTKEAVMVLPYPIPFNYAPLRAIQNNKRTALKIYREYLAKQAEEARSQEVSDAVSEEERKEAEAAKEAEERRLEKLNQTAEINKNRWAQKVKDEMPARTRELRKNVAMKTVLGVGAGE